MRRAIGRRLAFTAGGGALLIGVLAFVALVPFQRAEAERVAADQVGLLAEAVAASYEANVVADPHAVDETEHEARNDDVERERGHRTNEILSQLAHGESLVAIDVTNHAGVVKKSTRADHVGASRALPRRMRGALVEGDALTVSYAIPFTQRCGACHAASEDPVGVVHVVVEKQATLSSLEHFQWVTALALLLTYVVLVLLIVALTDRLVGQPIFALARLMRRAERGDFLVRARVGVDDEIGALSRAFNRMLRAITTLKADEVERERKLQHAEAELAMKKELADIAERLQESHTALERRVQAQELLMEAAHRLGSTLDRATLLERLARVIHDKLGRADFVIYLAVVDGNDRDAILEVARASGVLERDDVKTTRFKVGEGITGLVAETGAPVVVRDLREPWAGLAAPPPQPRAPLIAQGSLCSVPMLHKGRVVGVLEFYASGVGAFDDDDARLLQALGAQAAMAVVNADLYQTTLELSVTDTLTQLMNRRALNRVLDAELVRAQRFGSSLAVLMLDVDHFKQYNDRMGHLLGDEALKAVADTIAASVRKVDAVARFGGEEFCVVLPRADEQAGLDVADKLLRAVRALALPGVEHQPLQRMSISVGVAVYPDDMPAVLEGPATDALLKAADMAAYEAKKRGRDRVVSAGENRPRRPRLHEPGRTGRSQEGAPVDDAAGGRQTR